MGLVEESLKLLRKKGIGLYQVLMLAEVGSSAHGIRSESEDTDFTAVFVQTFDGLVNGCNESFMIRTAKKGERSGPNDIDINVYSLRRLARLAQNGNPSILTAIFSEKKNANRFNGWEELADLIRSKRVGYAFLGYMNQQLERWEGKASKRVSRPELVEAHGYDTKYASHVLRLGEQGLEYMYKGRFSVPMPESSAKFLTSVRAGEVPESEARRLAGRQIEALETAIQKSSFPEESPNIDKWLAESYKDLLSVRFTYGHYLA